MNSASREITPHEPNLIRAVSTGVVLDVAGETAVDKAVMRSRELQRTIWIDVLRDIVRSRPGT